MSDSVFLLCLFVCLSLPYCPGVDPQTRWWLGLSLGTDEEGEEENKLPEEDRFLFIDHPLIARVRQGFFLVGELYWLSKVVP